MRSGGTSPTRAVGGHPSAPEGRLDRSVHTRLRRSLGRNLRAQLREPLPRLRIGRIEAQGFLVLSHRLVDASHLTEHQREVAARVTEFWIHPQRGAVTLHRVPGTTALKK